ncbi:MAG: hypothetical protein ACLGXA_01840 [Acidobacteriota bacterium]
MHPAWLTFPSNPVEPSQPSRPAGVAAGDTAFADLYSEALQAANSEISQIVSADSSESASTSAGDDPLSFLELRAAMPGLAGCSPLTPGSGDLAGMQAELMQLVNAVRMGQNQRPGTSSSGWQGPSSSSGSALPSGTPADPLTQSGASSDVGRLISWLDTHAHLHSTHLCAASVRQAMEAAGITTTDRPASGDAGDYGPFLLRHGAQVVAQQFWEPKAGDIAVFDRTELHPAGHIQVFDGQHWVSDFVQHSFSPYRDQESTPPVTVYRLS